MKFKNLALVLALSSPAAFADANSKEQSFLSCIANYQKTRYEWHFYLDPTQDKPSTSLIPVISEFEIFKIKGHTIYPSSKEEFPGAIVVHSNYALEFIVGKNYPNFFIVFSDLNQAREGKSVFGSGRSGEMYIFCSANTNFPALN